MASDYVVYSLVCVRFTNSLTLDGGGEAGGADPPVVILITFDFFEILKPWGFCFWQVLRFCLEK